MTTLTPTRATAIDPMALILSGEAYRIWTELHHPHVPELDEMVKLMNQLSREERAHALATAKTLITYANVVQEAAAKAK